MKVSEALAKGKPTLSFEFFPPKTVEQEEHLFGVISELKKFNPDYVSVTYGALGTAHEKSFFWVKEIKEKFGIEPVAHLTCMAASKDEMVQRLNKLKEIKVENILALRGDPPIGEEKFVPPADGFRHANELVSFIKGKNKDICMGVAGYPEKHPEAKSLDDDIKYLKQKVDAGADYIVSQLFFINDDYFNFVSKCRCAGINVPIIPGLMPITSVKQLKKMIEICGAKIPEDLMEKLEKADGNKEAVIEIGVEQTVKQCQELLKKGVPGLHFFVMNQAGPISRILEKLKPFPQQ